MKGFVKSITCIFIFALANICAGCAADVAASGAQALYQRHNIQKNINDQYITMTAYGSINRSKQFEHTNVSVATFNKVVLIAGQVHTPEQKMLLSKLVRAIPDIEEVHNVTTISNSSSILTGASDAWITAKIKAKLLAEPDADPSQIKIVTENGTVYLMGIVQPHEANIAVDVARTTDGVQNVVKIFSYLRLSKV